MRRIEALVSLYPWTFLVLLLLPALYAGEWAVWTLGFWALGVPVWLVHWWRTGQGALLLLLLSVGLAASVWLLLALPGPPPRYPVDPGSVTGGIGVVASETAPSATGEVRFSFRLQQVEFGQGEGSASAIVQVRGYRDPSPPLGQRWSWQGRIAGATLYWKTGAALGWQYPWDETRFRVRSELFAAFARLDEPSAALAKALLLGAVDDLTPEEKRSFRDAGCSHVLALSGMHLSLLALVLGTLLHRRVQAWAAVGASQLVLALFCFLAGPIPSLYRAWMMALADGVAKLTHKTPEPLDLLAQSFLATALIWPGMTQTLSLQLSFLSLAGLMLWARPLEWRFRPWLGRFGAATLGSSVAAVAATLPLTLGLFSEVHWVGILISAPLVFLTTVYLFLSLVFLAFACGLPWLDLSWAAAVFRTLYDLIFGLTGWGSGWPVLTAPLVISAFAIAALGRMALFLYNKAHRGSRMPVSLNYDSPSDLQAFLDGKGFNTLKRWGQNFLINPGARKQILEALELSPAEAVWEIGPGLGALTHHLVQQGHPVTVFEIDPGYSVFLREEFGAAPAGFALWEGDVIKTWRNARNPGEAVGVKAVGNLPYNAASAIIADFIEGGFFPSVFVVTVQKEMADRMTASVGTKNYSSFSVLCQSVFQLSDVMVLRPGSFYPAPEVTSRVVKLVPHRAHPDLDHKRFSVFVRECFSSRRKTLRNNLPGAAAALRISDDTLKNAFLSEGIELGRRAETLSVSEFVRVYASTDRASTNRF